MLSVSSDIDVDSIMQGIDVAVAARTEAVAHQLWAKAVEFSPVWTGFYRSMWNLSVGSPQFIDKEKRWSMPNSYMRPSPITVAVRVGSYEPVYLTNSAPYAEDVEFGGPINVAHYVAERAMRSIK